MPRSRVLMVPSVLVALALIVPLAGAQEAEEEKPAPAAPETPSLEQLTRDVHGFMTRVLSDDAAAVTQADR